jgi:hypothetical protein
MCRLLLENSAIRKRILLFRDINPARISHPSEIHGTKLYSLDIESSGTNISLDLNEKSICAIINDKRKPRKLEDTSRGIIPFAIKDNNFLEIRNSRLIYAGCSVIFASTTGCSIYNTIDDLVKTAGSNEIQIVSTEDNICTNTVLSGSVDRIIKSESYRNLALLKTEDCITRSITEFTTDHSFTNLHWQELYIGKYITHTEFILKNENNYFRSRRILWQGT